MSPETAKLIDEQYLAIFDALMPVIGSEEGVVSFHDIDEDEIVQQVG